MVNDYLPTNYRLCSNDSGQLPPRLIADQLIESFQRLSIPVIVTKVDRFEIYSSSKYFKYSFARRAFESNVG